MRSTNSNQTNMKQTNINQIQTKQTKVKQTKVRHIGNRALLFLAAFAVLCAVGLGSCPNTGEPEPGGGKTLQSIAVTPPTKTEYTLGESLDTTGMVVTASYSDGSTATVPAGDGGYTISGFSSTTAGDKTITVSYGGKSDTFTVTVSAEQPVPVTGITLAKETLSLMAGQSEKLAFTITPDNAANKSVTWSSSASTVATVASDGTVTAIAAGTAAITVKTADGNFTDACQVTVTAPSGSIMSLPPMKTQFQDHFLMGNIFAGSNEVTGTGASAAISNPQLTRHYNALTPENHMKPSYMTTAYDSSSDTITWNTFNQATVDNFVNACQNGGIKVIGHTLLWHSQNPQWVWDQIASKGNSGNPVTAGTAIASKETALKAMRKYISTVAGRWAGKIYSWDVLNEVFPDNASGSANWKDAIRKGAGGEGQDANPWYLAIGSDFVYEGFLAARQADPTAILYYNDYNCDNTNRARLIRDMVRDVNERYAAAFPTANRKLIEGIGMQSHHNTNVTKEQIEATLNLFRPLGVKISISELDVLGQTYSEFSSSTGSGPNKHTQTTVTAQGLETQARLYGEYMQLFLDNSDIIDRVSLWGVTDDKSWRSGGLPLLFNPDGSAKAAYYRFVGALEE